MSSSQTYLKKLEGKRVLLFGGTSGIGHAVAEALSQYGASIVIAGSDQARLDSAAQRLSTDGAATAIETHVIDLSKTVELEQSFPELLKKASHDGSKPIDHIVWTAGDAATSLFADLSGADLKTIHSAMAVRLIAPTILARAIVKTDFKFFTKSSTSSITLTGGTGRATALVRTVGSGLEGLAQGLAVEMAPVRVNVVHPGLTLTERMKNMPEQRLEGAKKATVTQRLAVPEDVAEAYLYAMKNESVTGQTLRSDSGSSIPR